MSEDVSAQNKKARMINAALNEARNTSLDVAEIRKDICNTLDIPKQKLSKLLSEGYRVNVYYGNPSDKILLVDKIIDTASEKYNFDVNKFDPSNTNRVRIIEERSFHNILYRIRSYFNISEDSMLEIHGDYIAIHNSILSGKDKKPKSISLVRFQKSRYTNLTTAVIYIAVPNELPQCYEGFTIHRDQGKLGGIVSLDVVGIYKRFMCILSLLRTSSEHISFSGLITSHDITGRPNCEKVILTKLTDSIGRQAPESLVHHDIDAVKDLPKGVEGALQLYDMLE